MCYISLKQNSKIFHGNSKLVETFQFGGQTETVPKRNWWLCFICFFIHNPFWFITFAGSIWDTITIWIIHAHRDWRNKEPNWWDECFFGKRGRSCGRGWSCRFTGSCYSSTGNSSLFEMRTPHLTVPISIIGFIYFWPKASWSMLRVVPFFVFSRSRRLGNLEKFIFLFN